MWKVKKRISQAALRDELDGWMDGTEMWLDLLILDLGNGDEDGDGDWGPCGALYCTVDCTVLLGSLFDGGGGEDAAG